MEVLLGAQAPAPPDVIALSSSQRDKRQRLSSSRVSMTCKMTLSGPAHQQAQIERSDGSHEHSDGSHQEHPANPVLRMVPIRHTKVVHFIRHGQGFHNVAGAASEQEYLNPRWLDAHLTPHGWEQAAALKKHIVGLGSRFSVDVVVVSPLTRTLETAAGVFGSGPWSEQEAAPPFMTAQTELPGLRTLHGAISAAGCPPIVAFEGCREHFGQHYCDKRRSISEIRPLFPAVDFSLIEQDNDALWSSGSRETAEEVKRRGLHFVQWLMRRPEAHIAVVSHGGLLWHVLSTFGRGSAVQGELHVWFENCEMRSVVLADEGGTAHPDPWRFTGGRQVAAG